MKVRKKKRKKRMKTRRKVTKSMGVWVTSSNKNRRIKVIQCVGE